MVDVKQELSADGKIFEKAFKALKDKTLKVGWFENSKYEDGTPVTMAVVQNEFGNPAKKIPPRPFLRPTAINQENAWEKLSERNARMMLSGKITQDQFLELLGKRVVFDIQKSIRAVMSPPLSPITVQRRLSKYKNKKAIGNLTKPLVETGVMLGSIYSVIEDD